MRQADNSPRSKTQQTILITGATDGIGLALAHHYRQQSTRLILVGRRLYADVPLSDFPPENYIQIDLAKPDCAAIIASCLEEYGINQLDLLIHNAGLGYYGQLADQSPESIEAMMAVNLWAPITLTHDLWPYIKRVQGKVVFISSVASTLAGPDYTVYTASKAALDGFARNLRLELGNSTQVQVIHPGATRTGMHVKSGMPPDKVNWQRFPSAEKVALKIAKAIEGSKKSVTIGLGNQLLRFSGRHMGGPIDAAMRRFSPPPQPSPLKGEGAAPLSNAKFAQGEGAGGEGKAHNNKPYPKSETRSHNVSGKCCVITGAAAGIGRALAQRMAVAGYTIIGIDIDAEKAAQTEADLAKNGAAISFIIANLIDEDGLEQALSQLIDGPPVDIFIHNAGINAVGRFADSDINAQQAVLRLNLLAPIQMTAALLRYNKLLPTSSLVFISSLSHFVSYPGAAVYAASKDGIASFARSLSVSLAAQGIHSLTVFPGPTRTAHARRYSPDNAKENRRMLPEVLADQIYQALQRRQHTLIPGFGNKLFARLGLMMPFLPEAAMKKLILKKLALE